MEPSGTAMRSRICAATITSPSSVSGSGPDGSAHPGPAHPIPSRPGPAFPVPVSEGRRRFERSSEGCPSPPPDPGLPVPTRACRPDLGLPVRPFRSGLSDHDPGRSPPVSPAARRAAPASRARRRTGPVRPTDPWVLVTGRGPFQAGQKEAAILHGLPAGCTGVALEQSWFTKL